MRKIAVYDNFTEPKHRRQIDGQRARCLVPAQIILGQLGQIDFIADIGGQDLAIDQAIPNARVIDLSAVPGAEGVDGYDPFDLLARHGVEMGRKYLRGLFREARDASL